MTTAALESYLHTIFDTDIADIDVLHEGLNTMLKITTGSGDAYTLRSPEKLRETAPFNDLQTEYRILEELVDTPVPAPVPITYEADPTILGDPFIITTYLDGDTVPMGTDLPRAYRTPDDRERFADQYIDTLTTIHTLDTTGFTPVSNRSTPTDQITTARHRLETATRVTGRSYPRLDRVIDWLLTHAPPTAPTTLIHGDYRPGNLLFTTDTPTVSGVIDWEAAFLGDPRTELGYVSLLWGSDTDPRPDPDAIPGADATVESFAADGFQPYTTRPGSPTRDQLHTRYTNRAGIPFDNPAYFQAHAAVLLATVWEDLDRHDTTADTDPTRGSSVTYLAHLADSLVEAAPTPDWSATE